jgi:TonB-dependent SusC/RagA subfamily outer membrane receptor
VNYGAKAYRDSLSQVLYVDMVDASQKIVLTKIFDVSNGMAIGNFVIPSFLARGDYTLRAYTRWMLNFDSSLVFTKPIKLLEYSEAGKTTAAYTKIDTAGDVLIETEKSAYDMREKITLRIGVKDFIDNFIPADFSISVTDFRQVVPAPNEKNITVDFSFPKISLPDSLVPQDAHPIEHGINFSGRFVAKKGKGSQGLIAVARENTAQIFTITTEENGNFAFSNLKLYDTAKLSVLAKTITGKPGKVILDSIHYSPKTPIAEPLAIEVYKAQNPSRNNVSNDSLVAHMLEELTINDTRLDERGSSTFGLADQVVTGQWIRSSNIQDVLDALQAKVSGLRVVNGFVKLGPPTSFGGQPGGNSEPLVILDGVPANSFSDGSIESTVSLIRGLSPHDIERIEVLKYSNSSAYGSRGANGVIVITTRKNTGNYQRFGERGRFEEIKVAGYSAVKKFRAPDYTVGHQSHSLPDYRATLYWNPAVSTGTENFAEVSFYAADLPTQYRIVVEGITGDGRVVHGEKLISVAQSQ